jgi:signal transduction histidine kinase
MPECPASGVTEALRPSLLDDLGLIPALRALVTDFSGRSGLSTRFSAPESLPDLEEDAELALFRAVQEARECGAPRRRELRRGHPAG